MDREKVIKDLDELYRLIYQSNVDGEILGSLHDAIALLKEQEDLGKELENAIELIHKKNERIEKLLKEQEAVVRCKDCKDFEPDGIYTMCYRHNGLSPNEDWFCADGEKRE